MRRAQPEPERRRYGSGSVYPFEGGYIASLPRSASPTGKRQRERHATQAQAEAALERMRESARVRAAPGGQTLDAYLASWLESIAHSVREGTLTSYRDHVRNHISPLLGGIPLSMLRPQDVLRLQAQLLAKRSGRGKAPGPGKKDERPTLSPSTVARVLTTLRIALAAAVRMQAVPQNVAMLTGRLPRVERQPVEAMTPAMADRYRDAFTDTWLGPLVRLLVGSGLRLGEALSLDQGDCHEDEGWVRIRKSKTSIRAVPISLDAREAVKAARKDAIRIGPREPLFFAPREDRSGVRGRLHAHTVSHAVPRMAEAAGLPRISPHGFRHGAATIMVARGAHMRVVAAQLGHANPALTARVYAHVVPESQQAAADLLDRVAKG
ncbi:MAG TPA: tyrosine-type recombinase/integrase [Propionicimonas sp.]|jgi:integrase